MNTREDITNQLANLNHYINYPRLIPWVGSKYLSGKRVLVIAESHYLPEGVTYHHDVERWYSGNEQSLIQHIAENCTIESEKKNGINYINTSGILRVRSNDMLSEKRRKFSSKGHAIYRNIFSTLNSSAFNYTNYLDAIDHVAYYNYFQRPAELSGDSIKVTSQDKVIAESTLKHVIETLNPELILVVSSKVGKVIKPLLSDYNHVITAHPASPWWNRATKKGVTGKQCFSEFLEQNL